MKFDKIVSQVLNEDVSKDNRINALKKLNDTETFKVIETSTSRGLTDIHSTEIITGKRLFVPQLVRSQFIEHIARDFDDQDELESYVSDWVSEPLHSPGGEEWAILTGEETAVFIFSSKSKYFDYEEDEIVGNINEIDSLFNWNAA
jgi:hypothetical protein